MMNQDVKKQWVEALRADHAVCTDALKAGAGLDPLGVLCELHRKEVGGEWVPTAFLGRPVESYLADCCALPNVVKLWAGLEDKEPELQWGENRGPALITALVDVHGVTHAEIADLVEAQL
jgi:hypothetical protein